MFNIVSLLFSPASQYRIVENVNTLMQKIKIKDNADITGKRNMFSFSGFHQVAKSIKVNEEYATFLTAAQITWDFVFKWNHF